MRVLSATQMAAVDRRAIEELGIPGPVLMENAAIGAVDALGERFPDARRVVLFCGPGNNGGDGYAMARHLDTRFYSVHVYRIGREPSGDALLQHEIWRRSGREIAPLEGEECLKGALEIASGADVVVDALFGTGLSRPLDGLYARLVDGMNTLAVPILAVDLPSGLDGSQATPIGPFLRADLTVTFAAPKIAHVLAPSCDAIGELVVADLGIPPELLVEAPGSWHLLQGEELAAELLDASPGSHKGTFGHTLIVGGSRGMSGAVILAATAALRSGAGLVSTLVPASLVDLLEAGNAEAMTLALDSRERLGLSDVEKVLVAAEDKKSVALGPGLGVEASTKEAVRRLVTELPMPLVLDADGLNALEGDFSDLEKRRAPSILTPHPGEMARLLKSTASQVESDRPRHALDLAARSGAIVVLKGRRSLIASPEGELWINTTGNAGMASGGSGDVLTGAVAALLAQGYEAAAAARLAVYAHGLAGDVAAEQKGRAGLVAGDTAACLAAAWLKLERMP